MRKSRNGAGEDQEEGGDDDDVGPRSAHDPDGLPVPEAVPARRRLNSAALVDPGSEDGQDRGEHDHRGDRGEDHDGHTGVGERPDVRHGEQQEGGERDGDGGPAERHGAACGLHRAGQRDVHRLACGQLLPVPGDDEEAVVDAEPQPQGGGDVEGEDRHVGHAGEEREDEEGAEHGHDADRQRQEGGDQRSEDDDEGGRVIGAAEQLGLLEVLLGLLADLAGDLASARGGHGDDVPLARVGPRTTRPTVRPRALSSPSSVANTSAWLPSSLRRGDCSPRPIDQWEIRGDDAGLGAELLGQGGAGVHDTGFVDVAVVRGDDQDEVGCVARELLVQDRPRLVGTPMTDRRSPLGTGDR